MATALPKRTEIEEKYTWNLANIYPDETAWEADYRRLEDALPRLESFKGHLGDSPQKLLDWLHEYEQTLIIVAHLFVWTGMFFDSDTSNQAAGALRDRSRAI